MILFEGSHGYKIYMGRDKFENESLIKWGWPEDFWFHVDKLSSAHVYVRTPLGTTSVTAIPADVLEEAAQLTKQNSIEGCKHHDVDIVYTPHSNLQKDKDAPAGQVGYKDPAAVEKIKGVTKNKEILKRLEKTKKELSPDFKRERQDRDREVQKLRQAQREAKLASEREEERKKREAEREAAMSYFDGMVVPESEDQPRGDGTIKSCREIEEDFM